MVSATTLAASPDLRQQAIFHAAIATECGLKALIMKQQRFNSWPSRSARPDLWTHDLRSLASTALVDLTSTNERAAEWSTIIQWRRADGYDPKPVPSAVKDSFLDAAFGDNGVVIWLRESAS